MTAYRRPLVPAVLTAAALLLVACGDGAGSGGSGGSGTTGGDPAPGRTTVTSTAVSTASPSPASATDRPLGSPDLAPKIQERWSENPVLVSGIRTGRHEGFDRVVFDLTEGDDPGWRIDYVDEPMQQASGLPVEVAGDAYLHVMITNTTYPFELGIEDPLPPGNFPGAGVVEEIAYTSVFEGYTEVYLGVTEELPYSVSVLQDPKRLVIDVKHN